MTIPVDVADLPQRLTEFGRGYLLTSSAGRVKAVSVRAVPDAAGLLVPAPGRGSLANVAANPEVTLLFPPLDDPGLTLLVDGAAAVEGDDVRVVPASAVLHRPAT